MQQPARLEQDHDSHLLDSQLSDSMDLTLGLEGQALMALTNEEPRISPLEGKHIEDTGRVVETIPIVEAIPNRVYDIHFNEAGTQARASVLQMKPGPDISDQIAFPGKDHIGQYLKDQPLVTSKDIPAVSTYLYAEKVVENFRERATQKIDYTLLQEYKTFMEGMLDKLDQIIEYGDQNTGEKPGREVAAAREKVITFYDEITLALALVINMQKVQELQKASQRTSSSSEVMPRMGRKTKAGIMGATVVALLGGALSQFKPAQAKVDSISSGPDQAITLNNTVRFEMGDGLPNMPDPMSIINGINRELNKEHAPPQNEKGPDPMIPPFVQVFDRALEVVQTAIPNFESQHAESIKAVRETLAEMNVEAVQIQGDVIETFNKFLADVDAITPDTATHGGYQQPGQEELMAEKTDGVGEPNKAEKDSEPNKENQEVIVARPETFSSVTLPKDLTQSIVDYGVANKIIERQIDGGVNLIVNITTNEQGVDIANKIFNYGKSNPADAAATQKMISWLMPSLGFANQFVEAEKSSPQGVQSALSLSIIPNRDGTSTFSLLTTFSAKTTFPLEGYGEIEMEPGSAIMLDPQTNQPIFLVTLGNDEIAFMEKAADLQVAIDEAAKLAEEQDIANTVKYDFSGIDPDAVVAVTMSRANGLVTSVWAANGDFKSVAYGSAATDPEKSKAKAESYAKLVPINFLTDGTPAPSFIQGDIIQAGPEIHDPADIQNLKPGESIFIKPELPVLQDIAWKGTNGKQGRIENLVPNLQCKPMFVPNFEQLSKEVLPQKGNELAQNSVIQIFHAKETDTAGLLTRELGNNKIGEKFQSLAENIFVDPATPTKENLLYITFNPYTDPKTHITYYPIAVTDMFFTVNGDQATERLNSLILGRITNLKAGNDSDFLMNKSQQLGKPDLQKEIFLPCTFDNKKENR